MGGVSAHTPLGLGTPIVKMTFHDLAFKAILAFKSQKVYNKI